MNQELRIMGVKNKVKSIIHDSLFMIHPKGFTLIELLIVIGIIGILSGFLLSNFVGVRQRARDGVRKSNLLQIQSALELYRADAGGYPNPSLPICGGSLAFGSITYTQKIPCDPSNQTDYSYTSSDGSTYSITACLENSSDSQQDNPPNPEGTSCATSYTLYDP